LIPGVLLPATMKLLGEWNERESSVVEANTSCYPLRLIGEF
jgi:hypothetical protein